MAYYLPFQLETLVEKDDSLADGRSADRADRLEMMQDGKADFVHGPRIAAADDKSMLTIIPTVQKIELLQVARWKCMYIDTSLQHKSVGRTTSSKQQTSAKCN
jgi:hypothetical protein